MDKTKEDKTGPEDIPIVCKYLRMFLDDLSILLSNREVEFSIDLIPRAAPISKAPI